LFIVTFENLQFDVRGILGGMLGESKKAIEDEKLDKQ
jgi:hypothetical protein